MGNVHEHLLKGVYIFIKEEIKGRKGNSGYPDVNKRYSRYHREPWLLVTSLKGGQKIAGYIKNRYKNRMQIEQNFRDDKNPSLGFGWRHSKTKKPNRMKVLCLIAAIATWLLRFFGVLAESLNWHWHFQSNTTKTKRVLSHIFLGKQVLQHWPEKLRTNFNKILIMIQQQYQEITNE